MKLVLSYPWKFWLWSIWTIPEHFCSGNMGQTNIDLSGNVWLSLFYGSFIFYMNHIMSILLWQYGRYPILTTPILFFTQNLKSFWNLTFPGHYRTYQYSISWNNSIMLRSAFFHIKSFNLFVPPRDTYFVIICVIQIWKNQEYSVYGTIYIFVTQNFESSIWTFPRQCDNIGHANIDLSGTFRLWYDRPFFIHNFLYGLLRDTSFVTY